MNFKPTKWKVIIAILLIILIPIVISLSPDPDGNLVITLAPSVFVYIIWSLFEKKKAR